MLNVVMLNVVMLSVVAPGVNPIKKFWCKFTNSFCNLDCSMEQVTLKNTNSSWTTKITFYLETSDGQNSNLYLNAEHFLAPVLIGHLWQFQIVVL